MPMAAFLLRCLLCLCLVANGTASAMAGVRMLAPQEAQATVVAEPSAMAMPCHEQGPMLAKSHPGESPAPATQADHRGHGGSDCCDSAACTCDCMQVTQAELIVPMMKAMRLPHRETLPVLRETYAPPALSLPLRPPIALRR